MGHGGYHGYIGIPVRQLFSWGPLTIIYYDKLGGAPHLDEITACWKQGPYVWLGYSLVQLQSSFCQLQLEHQNKHSNYRSCQTPAVIRSRKSDCSHRICSKSNLQAWHDQSTCGSSGLRKVGHTRGPWPSNNWGNRKWCSMFSTTEFGWFYHSNIETNLNVSWFWSPTCPPPALNSTPL